MMSLLKKKLARTLETKKNCKHQTEGGVMKHFISQGIVVKTDPQSQSTLNFRVRQIVFNEAFVLSNLKKEYCKMC